MLSVLRDTGVEIRAISGPEEGAAWAVADDDLAGFTGICVGFGLGLACWVVLFLFVGWLAAA